VKINLQEELKMFKILMIILIFIALFAWEAPQLIRKKEIKELVVFSFLALIGLALSILAVIRSFI
jgi:O-antigen ligase